MLGLNTSQRYLLYSHPTDMRKSFDGLSGLIQNNLERNPSSGEVFVFINKRRDKIKLLHWSGAGFVLYYKRLEEGTFELPQYDEKALSISLNYTQMVMLIDGLSIKNVVRRKRFSSHI